MWVSSVFQKKKFKIKYWIEENLRNLGHGSRIFFFIIIYCYFLYIMALQKTKKKMKYKFKKELIWQFCLQIHVEKRKN